MQITQAALAILNVGFDEIARLAGAAVAFLALGKFGSYELGRCALYHLLVEPRHQLVIKRLSSGSKPSLEDCGGDRHVAAGLADRLIDRARRMPDLQAHIPEAIQDRFRDL